ncbi:hypothetical protein [Actinoplanes sp. NPDC026670]|uniref:hypothetical protein n=1 Tax=Actinoplanes sp. NPDC026670 TaxID=3154700 RepID=UPI0033E908A0
MFAAPNEVCRTLLAGHLPGRLSIAPGFVSHPATHATTIAGDILIAAYDDTPTGRALSTTWEGTHAVLSAKDERPFPESPWLGRARACGRLHPVPAPGQRAAALAFAEVNPLADLLDLGAGLRLYHLRLDVLVHDHESRTLISAAGFRAAVPDPLHPIERELLDDLRRHHCTDLAPLTGTPSDRLAPVRLDRHGITLSTPALRRVDFPEPADCPSCVSRMLRLSHADHP